MEKLDDYIVYYLNNPLGHNEINEKNLLIKKIIDSHQSISTSSIRDCFNAIDTIFFNRTITEKINKDNYILSFDFTNKLKKRAGQFVYSYQMPKMRIDISKIILDNIFKNGVKVVEIGGVKLRDLNDVLINIMQHEMLHLVLFLLRNHPLIINDKKVSSGHTRIFKILLKIYSVTCALHTIYLKVILKNLMSQMRWRKVILILVIALSVL